MTYALLVPCYNAEQFINGFLENIALQTKSFDEIIFYDDCSSDGTLALLQSKNLKVLKGVSNNGPGHARNQLVKVSACDWVHFHDIDDELMPEYLERMCQIVDSNQSVDVILCNVNWIDGDTKKIMLEWEYSNIGINEDPIRYTIANPIGGINGLYRKNKISDTTGFREDIRIWEDADFHINLAANHAKFYVEEQVLSYSIRNPKSASEDQHLGWKTRLELLLSYQKKFSADAHQHEIGIQLQKVAVNLIILGDIQCAKSAYQLSEKCNVPVPDNPSLLWNVIKFILPGYLRIGLRILQLKYAFRNNRY